MFRGTKKSELDPKNFGAGSIVKEGNFQEYLVVSSNGKYARLLNLKTFELFDPTIEVEDPNFLSKDETRSVIKSLSGTFTDYEYDAKGMKK